MPIVKTRVEAAKLLEVTEKAVGLWKKQDGFPHRDDEQYDIEAIQAWRDARGQQRAKATDDSKEVREQTAAVKLQILAHREASDLLDLERKRGSLMPRALVQELIGIMATSIRGVTHNLQRMGHVTAAQMIIEQLDLTKKQINDRIDAAIRGSQE